MNISEQARFWLYDHHTGTWTELCSLTAAHHTVTPTAEMLDLELLSGWEIHDFRLAPDSYYAVVIAYPHGYVGQFLFTRPTDVEHYIEPVAPDDAHGLRRQRWHLIRVGESDLGSCPAPPAYDAPRTSPTGPPPELVPAVADKTGGGYWENTVTERTYADGFADGYAEGVKAEQARRTQDAQEADMGIIRQVAQVEEQRPQSIAANRGTPVEPDQAQACR